MKEFGAGQARPAVFLDRDGVINENRADYVKSWDELHFVPGVLEALRRLSQSEYAIIVVTNQAVVGRGTISLEQAWAINHQLILEIEAHGGRVDACYLCPHRPDEQCHCRKPAPGMLLQAQADLDLDLRHSYLIGDAVTDMQAAQAAGVQGILVLTGRGQAQAAKLPAENAWACPILPDLPAAIDFIFQPESKR